MERVCTRTAVAACLLLWGCGKDDDGPKTPLTGGITAGGATEGNDGIGEVGGDEKFDLGDGSGGMASAGDAGQGAGCEKIDFLFVIDNSGSMADEQTNLVSSFPDFIDSIRSATAVDNYNIMVVDTDECVAGFGAGQAQVCDELSDPDCCESQCATFPAGTCNSAACSCPQVADACDNQLGAGRRTDKDGAACPVDGDARYMVETQGDLESTFACVAEVGINGSGNEQTLAAVSAAVSPAMTDAGGCNEGFVRDDALLVVSIITDEEDDLEDPLTGFPGFGSPGEPPGWYQAVLAAKKGEADNAVVLALVGPNPPDDCPPLDKQAGGVDGAEIATRILEFTTMFNFGFVGPVCADSYGPFFAEAVSVVSEACDGFTPVG